MHVLEHYADQLEQIKRQGNFRHFHPSVQQAERIQIAGQDMLNMASNDYLGLATCAELRNAFFQTYPQTQTRLSASSSRLLTGHYPEYDAFELSLSSAYQGRAALLFNSGYHMNIGILPALSDAHTLILADKLVHASMIDGMRLSSAKFLRYRHNDLAHLQQLLSHYQDDEQYARIIVVTESIFSMDGDETDLTQLVALKKQFNKVVLYVDDAHGIGVRGRQGLGCAEQYGVIAEIDFLVGTFGKALASVGGYLICDPIIREFLINRMRPLIFSTALPPINIAWSHFVFQHMQSMQAQRQHLAQLSLQLQQGVLAKAYQSPSTSQIVPVIIGDAHQSVEQAKRLQQQGFYVLAVRPPTVPVNSSRLRICLNARFRREDIDAFLQHLPVVAAS